MSFNHKSAVVIDNGTGYTKMGYAGNYEPNYIIPTIIANNAGKTSSNAGTMGGSGSSSIVTSSGKDENIMNDLDYYIGHEALQPRHNYNIDYPIRHGVIESWDSMEKYWNRCIYQYLNVDPEEHYFLLTEPPLNTPENRELTAEIMFETFNVPALYIAVQAVLALCASLLTKQSESNAAQSGFSRNPSITGTVIDSGDGVTHIIPVFEGYVIGSCIKHIPLAGRDVTNFVVQMLRDRGENFPAEDALQVAKKIKEQYCYVCPDIVKEYNKYDANADGQRFTQLKGIDIRTNKPYVVDVGYERFLGYVIFNVTSIHTVDVQCDCN
jgi:actin-related protein 3